MNKIKTIICATWMLVLVSTGTVLLADSSNFAGPYVGLSGFSGGIEAKGTANTTLVDGNDTDRVSFGKVTVATGFEGGYVIPLGSLFLLDVGASYLIGEASIAHENDSNNSTTDNVTFTANNFVTFFIAPTVALSDTSSLYIKWGLSEADVDVSGDINNPADLSGETFAIGTRTVLDSGIFIKTEAGYTEYNGISAHGKGLRPSTGDIGGGSTNASSTNNSYSAEPLIAYGSVSLGFRF
jgi:hypothetical protein